MAAMALLAVSCVKNEDWELFRHLYEGDCPVRIEGSASPTYGLPIARGEFTVEDIINSLGSEANHYVDPSQEVVTIIYDTTISNAISSGNKRHGLHKASPARKDEYTIYSKDTVLSYSLDIDLFDNAGSSDNLSYDIELNRALLNIETYLKAQCSSETRHALENYLSATIDNLTITYVDHEGQTHPYNNVSIDPITMDEILDGTQIEISDVDISPIINSLPRQINASVRMTINVSSAILDEDPSSLFFSDFIDLIELERINYTAHVSATVPFNLRIGHIAYTDTLDVDELGLESLRAEMDELTADGIDIELGNTSLSLIVDNGLPLGAVCQLMAVPANGARTEELTSKVKIAPADMVPSQHIEGSDEAGTAIRSTLEITLSKQKIDKLLEADHIIAYIELSTDGHTIVLRKTDRISMKVNVKTSINAHINTEIGK